MRTIDFGYSYFTDHSIIPSVGDSLTSLWGLKIVRNLMNGYGIIGTVRLESYSISWINLNLTKIYQFPPLISCLYRVDGGALNYECPRPTAQLGDSAKYLVERRVVIYIKGDVVGFRSNSMADYQSNGDTHKPMDVYFRIHGV